MALARACTSKPAGTRSSSPDAVVIVRGGSNYRPLKSGWYFPQAKENNKHEKYFLFDDRYERVGTVGFRCVVDAADDTASADIIV